MRNLFVGALIRTCESQLHRTSVSSANLEETRLVLDNGPCHVIFGRADLGCRLIEPHGTDAAQGTIPR